MRLATLTDARIPKHLITVLEQSGIRTVADLLFYNTPQEIYRGLPSSAVSFNEFLQCIEIVAEASSTPGTSAMHALMQAQHAPSISTGVPIFDDLYGNLTGHEVIEISGCPRSGKSTLALNVVLHYLLKHVEAKATWIDTTGSFSVENASLVLKSLQISAPEDNNAMTVLERLQVSQAFEVDDVYNVLEEDSDDEPSSSHIHFIVIDAITPLLGPNLSAASSQGHAIMVHLMRHLRERARTKRHTVLVLNASSQAKDGNNLNSVFSGTKRQPSLGPSFSFLTDSTLWLSTASCDPRRTPDECIITAEVLHSKNTRSRTWSTFVIRDGIICNTDSPQRERDCMKATLIAGVT